ncbi:MAG: hypothetical protein IJB27_07610 [Clostridia bacterium]|nr:hypothetical protein [Clostridia bacterium]
MAKNTGAYDLSLFETSSPRLRTVNSQEKSVAVQERKVRRERRTRLVANVAMGILITAMVVLMIVFRAQRTEVGDRITELEAQLRVLESETSRLTNELSSKLSVESVEQFAQENGMEKLESYQIEYITVGNGDKIEVADPEPQNAFDTIGAAIAGWFGG